MDRSVGRSPSSPARLKKAFGLGGLLPSGVVYRFDLRLVDEGGVYRVREAAYEVVPPRDN